MKHMRKFKNEAEYRSFVEGDQFIAPNTCFLDESDHVVYEGYPEENSDPFNGYEYVDLGLPSGTLWAKCNVGGSSEGDCGLYFQWGDVVGYSSSQVGNGEGKKYFSWDDYKYCNGSSSTLTKYNTNSSYGIVDNLTTLLPEDDAASVNMGGSWHMPSKKQCEELINSSYTTSIWTIKNGVKGYLITSNTNGNTLFLPASGFLYLDYVDSKGSGGFYWSSSPNGDYPYSAYYLSSSSNKIYVSMDRRLYGNTVRGVIG